MSPRTALGRWHQWQLDRRRRDIARLKAQHAALPGLHHANRWQWHRDGLDAAPSLFP
jgi:hypothetical protein